MVKVRSRAYKLQLSPSGVRLFLQCHCRLCHAAGDFLPYGATLLVAVTLLHQSTAEIAAQELLSPEIARHGGRLVRFVGTSPALAVMVQDIAMTVEKSGLVHPEPAVWKIFLAALGRMETATDRDLLQTLSLSGASPSREVR